MTGLVVKMAGVDITSTVDEMSIEIDSVLGQGAGVGGSGSTGRAATANFVTKLGPAVNAVGAGTSVSTPTLVRMGEVQIWDKTGKQVYGGYAAKLTDQTEKTQVYTKVECYDYWQHLDRIQVQKVYSGQTDIQIIKDLCTHYAPWLLLDQLPSIGTYFFAVKNFKAITLQKALQQIADDTGYLIYVGSAKHLHYQAVNSAANAPFGLAIAPDFSTTYPHYFDTSNAAEVDDTAAINRAIFYGGKKPSSDFTQDLSTQANGSNKLFVLAYYPRVASDGAVHITCSSINGGADLTIGYLLGVGTQNKLKSDGGTADVLLNSDAHTVTFDIAPADGAKVKAKYRYEYPMVIQLTDQKAHDFYGAWYDGVISDQTVFDSNVAVGRCRTLLTEQKYGLVTLKPICYQPGIVAGQILSIYNPTRGIDGAYVVQEVHAHAEGNGLFRYELTLGAWSKKLTDIIADTANAAFQAQIPQTSDSQNNGQDLIQVDVQQVGSSGTGTDLNLDIHFATAHSTHTPSVYYAHASVLNDGHDAYPGLCTTA